jgi:hypothetical protein
VAILVALEGPAAPPVPSRPGAASLAAGRPLGTTPSSSSSSYAIDDAFVVESGRVDSAHHRPSLPVVYYGRPTIVVERRLALPSLSSSIIAIDDARLPVEADFSPATVARPRFDRGVAGIVGPCPGVRACVRTRVRSTFACWWVFSFLFLHFSLLHLSMNPSPSHASAAFCCLEVLVF